MDDFAFQQQLIQFLHAWAHILKAHTDRNHREAVAFQIGDELGCIPAVHSDLLDVELLVQIVDRLTHEVVIDHISFCYMEEALLFPDVIGNVITSHPQIQRFPRQPEMRHHDVFISLILWREHHDKSRDVTGAG